MGRDEDKCSTILRKDTRSGVLRGQLEKITTELGSCGEVERVEGEKLLVKVNCVRARGSGRAGEMYGILLRGTRKPGNDDMG